MSVAIEPTHVDEILAGLLGRDLLVRSADQVAPHPKTLRGLVTNENELVAVIGSDLDFAHYTGAALAMMPRGRAEDANGVPDQDLLDVYVEIANVLSRIVDEAMPMRVRIDPGMDHSEDDMMAIVSGGHLVSGCQVDVDSYGVGSFGVWRKA